MLAPTLGTQEIVVEMWWRTPFEVFGLNFESPLPPTPLLDKNNFKDISEIIQPLFSPLSLFKKFIGIIKLSEENQSYENILTASLSLLPPLAVCS